LRLVVPALAAGFPLRDVARAMGVRQIDVEARLACPREELGADAFASPARR